MEIQKEDLMTAEKIKQFIIDKLGVEVWSENRRCPGLRLQVRGDWTKGCEEAATKIAAAAEANKAPLLVQIGEMRKALEATLAPMSHEEAELLPEIDDLNLTQVLDPWQQERLAILTARKNTLTNAQDVAMNALAAVPSRIHWGACWHVYRCIHCGQIQAQDSSD